MKKIIMLAIALIIGFGTQAQNLEVEGKAKITEMDKVNTSDSVVVRLADGTLAVREVSTSSEVKVLRISNDTIFLANGGFIKLPQDQVDDADADLTMESQLLSTYEDTILMSDGNFVVVEGLSKLFICFKPNKTVQERLICGETPLEIFNRGIPVDSSYGKTYAGGLIFYLDTLDIHPFEGLVAAPMDQNYNGNFTRPWGLVGKDLPNVPNEVTCCIPTGPGSLIGKGQMNTDSIVVNGCITAGDVANICSDLSINSYDDWFLPSILELAEMYTNLHLAGIGDFAGEFYWSSTEYGSSTVWVQNFVSSLKGFGYKSSNGRVRAVRAF